MGQKVHPIGFRVGITKKYQSQWFARFHKYNYAQSLLEDHMLRTTLMKIFPDLLNSKEGKKNSVMKENLKDAKDTKLTAQITQIKIERSLIPYEIGIQIYAQNSELIKSAIDNLKINTDLFCYLQKTRQYLLKLKQELKIDKNLNSGFGTKTSGLLSLEPVSSSPNTTEPNDLFVPNQEKLISDSSKSLNKQPQIESSVNLKNQSKTLSVLGNTVETSEKTTQTIFNSKSLSVSDLTSGLVSPYQDQEKFNGFFANNEGTNGLKQSLKKNSKKLLPLRDLFIIKPLLLEEKELLSSNSKEKKISSSKFYFRLPKIKKTFSFKYKARVKKIAPFLFFAKPKSAKIFLKPEKNLTLKAFQNKKPAFVPLVESKTGKKVFSSSENSIRKNFNDKTKSLRVFPNKQNQNSKSPSSNDSIKGLQDKSSQMNFSNMKGSSFSGSAFSKNKNDNASNKINKNLNLQNVKKKRLVHKRLQKRQTIKNCYERFILKGLIVKKTNSNLVRQILTKTKFLTLENSSLNFSNLQQTRRFIVGNLKKNKSSTLDKSVKKTLNLNNKKSINSSAYKQEQLVVLSQNKGKQDSSAEIFVGSTDQKKKANIFISLLANKKELAKTKSLGLKKKFLSFFINKTNKNFLKHLKQIMIYWHKQKEKNGNQIQSTQTEQLLNSHILLNFAPLGYGQHWNSLRLKQFRNQPIKKLMALTDFLEKKALSTMTKLRKNYMAFGFLSKTQGLSYYQIITFLKNIKKLVNKLSMLKIQNLNKNVPDFGNLNVSTLPDTLSSNKLLQNLKEEKDSLVSNTQNPKSYMNIILKPKTKLAFLKPKKQVSVLENTNLKKIVNNIENQYRKIKFISYLKNLVQKHRQKNIFFYLRTISDANKDLKVFKKFTKIHANFLFGLKLENSIKIDSSLASPVSDFLNAQTKPTVVDKEKSNTSNVNTLYKQRIKNVLSSGLGTKKDLSLPSYATNNFSKQLINFENQKLLQHSFINQIEKQREMSFNNINLIPKISIKFYNICDEKNLECKASLVADSIIDALEKRKAFRKVIKDAKENLMRISKVKGVKIQVAGRLNGAEIARTEWVRAGRVPLQTLRANIDYCSKPANTIYGIIGVKVWIFKGYSKIL